MSGASAQFDHAGVFISDTHHFNYCIEGNFGEIKYDLPQDCKSSFDEGIVFCGGLEK